ncbi:hypothetical protein TIFTF001_026923 [Ficus carica]|uniref:Uncharacterized protein n=1 Tax=Ficus carica TaxID=3494 RepID=A0AA88DM28_FICCA|nr:hypothetical protein TIFTF001_026923 [Ficus carica]
MLFAQNREPHFHSIPKLPPFPAFPIEFQKELERKSDIRPRSSLRFESKTISTQLPPFPFPLSSRGSQPSKSFLPPKFLPTPKSVKHSGANGRSPSIFFHPSMFKRAC